MRDRDRFRFTEKPKARGGKLSVVLAAVSAGLLAAMLLAAWILGGKAGTYAGAAGLCGILLGGYGFIQALQGLRERNVEHRLSYAGALFSGLAVICWLAMFLVGLKLS